MYKYALKKNLIVLHDETDMQSYNSRKESNLSTQQLSSQLALYNVGLFTFICEYSNLSVITLSPLTDE